MKINRIRKLSVIALAAIYILLPEFSRGEDQSYAGIHSKSNSNVLDARNAFPGLTVTEVVENSPAEAAGLEVGDILMEADGIELLDPEQWNALVTEKPIGSPIQLKFERTRGMQETELITTRRVSPLELDATQVWVEKEKLGVKFKKASEAQIAKHELEPGQGLEVVEVAANGPMEKENIEPGSILLSINGTPLFSAKALIEGLAAMEEAESIEMEYLSESGRKRSKKVDFFSPERETKKVFFPPFLILDKTGTTSELSIPLLLFKREKLAGASKWRILYFIRFETGEADELLEIAE